MYEGKQKNEEGIMCLGVPGQVLEVKGEVATVDFWGVRRPVMLHVVDEPVQPGDYVLVHVGFAIRKIPPEEVQETLAFYDLILQAADEDLMADDVRGEVRAAGGEP